jgi:hypothetical protein
MVLASAGTDTDASNAMPAVRNKNFMVWGPLVIK